MTLKTQLSDLILQKAQEHGRYPVHEIRNASAVSGGSINRALKLETDGPQLFVKLNDSSRYPGMFQAEAKGLQMLGAPGVIRVPRVIAYDALDDEAFILLEFVEEGSSDTETWENFGERLAALHRQSEEYFGSDHGNYMGSLQQRNEQKSTWPEFFATQRIEPQLRMAGGFFSSTERKRFDRLLARVDEMVPEEKPALVHGDLWSGNYLIDQEGQPVLIDPATYYGHREVDIAMMHLFGGFSPEVFRSYNASFPLENGWKERIDLHNLYPLLVHVNLFGGGYAAQVKGILERFA